jgi:large conductance mechanosensitive channel
LLKEFKEFVLRGNVLDMAVAIVIGIAFGSIVSSIVNDLIMPPIGLILGKVDFSNLFINLSDTNYTSLAEAKRAGAAVVAYGTFINTLINFLIVAFVMFAVIKVFNQFRRKQEPPAPTTKECPYCFTGIHLKATRCPHCTSELKTP